MNQSKVINYLAQNISSLNGVGKKNMNLLKKKKIEKISDLLWNTPQGFTDRSNVKQLDNLEIGKITTIKCVLRTVRTLLVFLSSSNHKPSAVPSCFDDLRDDLDTGYCD